MIKTYSQSFRTIDITYKDGGVTQPNINCGDSQSNLSANQVQLTPGTTQVDTVQLSSTSIESQITVIAVSVQAYLSQTISAAFGKIGKIYSGLIVGRDVISDTTNSFSQGDYGFILPYISPMSELPSNSLLTGVLYDPSVDELPPYYTDSVPQDTVPINKLLPASLQIIPQSPIKLDAGSKLSMGIWIVPSLIGFVQNYTSSSYGLTVYNASTCVVYDDGIT